MSRNIVRFLSVVIDEIHCHDHVQNPLLSRADNVTIEGSSSWHQCVDKVDESDCHGM